MTIFWNVEHIVPLLLKDRDLGTSPVWRLLNVVVLVHSCYILSSFTDKDVLLKRSHEIDELLSVTRGLHAEETRARVFRRRKPHKEERYRTTCLNGHLCFPVVFAPRPNPTTKKGCGEKNTLPKHRCPYPECEYETEDVTDELAAVLLTVHSNGTHMQT